MEVINKTTGAETKEIAEALTKMLSKENDVTYLNHPLIFIETYVKDKKRNLEKHMMYCMLEQPVEISISRSKKDKIIYLRTIRREIYYKKGDENWSKTAANLEIPLTARVIDMEKLAENEKLGNFSELGALRGENIFRMYIGDLAYKRFSEECTHLKKSSK